MRCWNGKGERTMENKQTNKQTDFANHGDTISRQTAIDALTHKWNGMVTSVFDVINSLPSAQPDLDSAYTEGYTAAESKYRAMWDEIPKIIRCKDCKHRIKISIDIFPNVFTWGCNYMDAAMGDNDFCSKAERRTDG